MLAVEGAGLLGFAGAEVGARRNPLGGSWIFSSLASAPAVVAVGVVKGLLGTGCTNAREDCEADDICVHCCVVVGALLVPLVLLLLWWWLLVVVSVLSVRSSV